MGVPNAGSVLVVDDNPALREAIARSLTRRGYHVTIAVDAVQGLERLQGAVFDVVITDLQGRERGGLWLWRKALEAPRAHRSVRAHQLGGPTRGARHATVHAQGAVAREAVLARAVVEAGRARPA